MGRVILELAQDVGGDDDGHPLLPQPQQGLGESDPGLGIEPRGRLVQKQDRRVMHDALGDGETLAKPAGERAGLLAQTVGDGEALGGKLHRRRPLLRRHAERRGTIEQALLDRQIVIEPIAVGKKPHAAMAVARLGQDIEPRHIDLAGIGRIQPRDAAQQRRFPRAVRADQRGDGLAFEGEADVVEGPRAGIVEDEPADGDHVGHSAHFLIKLNRSMAISAKYAPPLSIHRREKRRPSDADRKGGGRS